MRNGIIRYVAKTAFSPECKEMPLCPFLQYLTKEAKKRKDTNFKAVGYIETERIKKGGVL